jgi:hypothetical protein
MTVLKALATVIGTALAFGLAGGTIGGLLGALTPSYFRQVFYVRDRAHFDATEMGIGLSVTQGLVWGLVIGLLIVAIIAWKETRIARAQKDNQRA